MIELGPCKGTIVSHRSRMIGDKMAISFQCDVGTERCEALVWISDKAMGMARRALKQCGFDIDKDALELLDIRPTMLAGTVIPLMVEDYNGKQSVKVDIDQRADKATLADATKKLRAVKKVNTEADDGGIPF